MPTTCDCVLTRIDDKLQPALMQIAFSKELADMPSGSGSYPPVLQIPIDNYLNLNRFEIVSVEDKNDEKSTGISYTSPNISYAINPNDGGSKYWSFANRTDSFKIQYKDKVTGESAFLTIRLTMYDMSSFSTGDVDITLSYPYPKEVRVNLEHGSPSSSDFMFYEASEVSPIYFDDITESPFGNKEVMIKLKDLGELSTVVSFSYFIANQLEGDVNPELVDVAFANVNIAFTS